MTTDLAPEAPEPPAHPVRINVQEDLGRSRLTVFFRLLLAVPHFIWFWLWGIFAVLAAIVNWFAVLIRGQTPAGLHRFLGAYVNYGAHVYAYVSVATRKYPGFVGDPGYELDVVLDPPGKQNRWTVFFRLLLGIPAFMLSSVFSVLPIAGYSSAGPVGGPAIVAWFYSLVLGRAPEGTTRLMWYQIHYGAQTWAYFFLLTDRYPNGDPSVLGVPRPRAEPHPVTLRAEEDGLTRSRLTVFFRLPLFIPHYVWLTLWGYLVFILAVVNWLCTLVMGRSPAFFHRFFTRYQRYALHVYAFITLVANPFPGFVGAPGSYPVDLDVAPPERQNRWGVLFRLLLVLPSYLILFMLLGALFVVALFGWFVGLFTGRMPRGLRNLGAYALRYNAQVNSYGLLLLTSRYPYAGPPA